MIRHSLTSLVAILLISFTVSSTAAQSTSQSSEPETKAATKATRAADAARAKEAQLAFAIHLVSIFSRRCS